MSSSHHEAPTCKGCACPAMAWHITSIIMVGRAQATVPPRHQTHQAACTPWRTSARSDTAHARSHTLCHVYHAACGAVQRTCRSSRDAEPFVSPIVGSTSAAPPDGPPPMCQPPPKTQTCEPHAQLAACPALRCQPPKVRRFLHACLVACCRVLTAGPARGPRGPGGRQ